MGPGKRIRIVAGFARWDVVCCGGVDDAISAQQRRLAPKHANSNLISMLCSSSPVSPPSEHRGFMQCFALDSSLHV